MSHSLIVSLTGHTCGIADGRGEAEVRRVGTGGLGKSGPTSHTRQMKLQSDRKEKGPPKSDCWLEVELDLEFSQSVFLDLTLTIKPATSQLEAQTHNATVRKEQ